MKSPSLSFVSCGGTQLTHFARECLKTTRPYNVSLKESLYRTRNLYLMRKSHFSSYIYGFASQGSLKSLGTVFPPLGLKLAVTYRI